MQRQHIDLKVKNLSATVPCLSYFSVTLARGYDRDLLRTRAMLGLDVIDRLTGGRVGVHDVACPRCGPTMRTLAEQWKRVLRVWRIEDGFAAFYCVPCGETGYARDRHSAPADPAKVARARAERDALARTHKTKQLRRAKSLWSHRQPIAVSIAETYLREARGYGGPSPATLAFVPAGGQHCRP